jgi:signal transduction histidine kinase
VLILDSLAIAIATDVVPIFEAELRAELGATGHTVTYRRVRFGPESNRRLSQLPHADLVVSFGASATEHASRALRGTTTPHLFAFVPRELSADVTTRARDSGDPPPTGIAGQLQRGSAMSIAARLLGTRPGLPLRIGLVQPYLVVARSAEAWNWTVFAAYPLAAVKSAIRKVNLAVTGSLILTGLCMALSLFVGVDRLVISPIRQLEHKLRALAAGRPPHHLRLAGADEIAELAAEMDAMAAGIAAYTAELERSNSELDSFAAAVGHDLRSPLRAIKTIAGWIEADAEALPATALAHLDRLRDQIARMETMLQDLLHYAKASQVTGPLGACDVQELLSEQLKLLSPKKAVELTVGGELPVLITPEPPLALVLRNLIDNAIQHHDQPTVAIDIHLSRRGRRVVFQVKDDGPGIPPDEHVRLFALFGDRDRRGRGATRAGGCGIGLALVRRIVQRLGGSLELKSNETGRGTCAVFDWPLDCHMLPTLTNPAIRLPSSLVPAA